MTSATPKPRAGEHTKGPWRLNDHTADENCIYIEADHAGIATVFTGDEHDKANARRIVACVNALEGWPTEALEMAIPGSFFTAISVQTERDALKAQNTEILSLVVGFMTESNHRLFTDALAARLAKHGR